MNYVVRLRDSDSKTIAADVFCVDTGGNLSFLDINNKCLATIHASCWVWVEEQAPAP